MTDNNKFRAAAAFVAAFAAVCWAGFVRLCFLPIQWRWAVVGGGLFALLVLGATGSFLTVIMVREIRSWGR